MLTQRRILLVFWLTLIVGCATSQPSSDGAINSRSLGIAFKSPARWCSVARSETAARYAYRPCGDETTVIAVDRFSRAIEMPDADDDVQRILLPESLGEMWVARFVGELDFAVGTITDSRPIQVAGNTGVSVAASYRASDGAPICVRTILLPLQQGVISLQLQRACRDEASSLDAAFDTLIESVSIR